MLPQSELGLNKSVALEIEEIALSADEDFFQRTWVPLDKQAPQLRAIQIATRIAPKEIVVWLIADCALKVLDLVEDRYPDYAAPKQVVDLLHLPVSEKPKKFRELYEELQCFADKVRRDNDLEHEQVFNQLGFVPMEKSIAIDAIPCALSVISLAAVASFDQSTSEFNKTVDQLIISFIETNSIAERSSAGQWIIGRIAYHLDFMGGTMEK